MQANTHASIASELRAMADFIEAHPELPCPCLVFATAGTHDPKATGESIAALGLKAKIERPYAGANYVKADVQVSENGYYSCVVDEATLVPVGEKVLYEKYALPRREFDGRELPSSDPCFDVAASEVTR